MLVLCKEKACLVTYGEQLFQVLEAVKPVSTIHRAIIKVLGQLCADLNWPSSLLGFDS